MNIISTFHKHVRALGQKLNAENINHLGQKVMHTGHVIGRKFSNTLSKIESVGHAALPVVQTIASMAGYPELGALASASKGLSRISNLRNNVDHVRQLTQ